MAERGTFSLGRKPGEAILMNHPAFEQPIRIEYYNFDVRDGSVRIGVTADKSVTILREEISDIYPINGSREREASHGGDAA